MKKLTFAQQFGATCAVILLPMALANLSGWGNRSNSDEASEIISRCKAVYSSPSDATGECKTVMRLLRDM